MKVETASGVATIDKRSRYGKFLLGYISTGAFSGADTLRHAWVDCIKLKAYYPSISWKDAGKLIGDRK